MLRSCEVLSKCSKRRRVSIAFADVHTSADTRIASIKEVETTLFIHDLADWYNVPKSHIKYIAKANHLLKLHPSVEDLVRAAYPSHPWDHSKFVHKAGAGSVFTPQLFMERIIRSVFPPGVKIESNARAVHGIVNATGFPLEIDVYLPQYKLGFEYQERDKAKKQYSHKKGITLLDIPFWWDWKPESLVATVRKERPDLLGGVDSKGALPLSQDPPQYVMDKWNYEVPGLGVPMLATDIPTGRAFSPLGWWVCEKYDGIRGLWNPNERVFFSRWGTPLSILFSIVDTMSPTSMLDGEQDMVWESARNAVSSDQNLITSLVLWKNFKFVVFDCPQADLLDEPYTTRYSSLKDIIPSATGGEGLILRDPSAGYLHGYSPFLYKHKGFRDAEALVLKKISDTRYLCRVAKFSVRTRGYDPEKLKSHVEPPSPPLAPTSSQQSVPSSDFYTLEMPLDDKVSPSDIGEITEGSFVSFKYLGETTGFGLPLHPKIYAVRSDVKKWEQLLHARRKPPDHKRIWGLQTQSDWSEPSSRRAFFDEYARENHFDPLLPENWYGVTKEDVLEKKGSHGIAYYSSIPNALLELYPDIGLELHNFKQLPKMFWTDKQNCRMFLEKFAFAKQFDPLLPDNWYSVTAKDFTSIKGGAGILQHYQGSVAGAILDTYGFIGLDAQKLTSLTSKVPKEERARRFFDDYAAKNNFDPLVPENWYKVSHTDLINAKAGELIRNSSAAALMAAYPTIGLQANRFRYVSRNFWSNMQNCKRFLDDFAASQGFDPLLPQNWYPISTSQVLKSKGGFGIIEQFKGSLVDALRKVYPNVVFNTNLFKHATRTNKVEREQTKLKLKLFFDALANRIGIDPGTNGGGDASKWLSITKDDIIQQKGGAGIMKKYGDNYLKAIAHAYPDLGIDWKTKNDNTSI